MKLIKILPAVFLITLFSFTKPVKEFEFDYPKNKEANITFNSGRFKKFSKEWRGSDYYYFAENDGFVCSVLFYKLNEEEQLTLIELPKAAMSGKLREAGKEIPENSPIFAYAYFKNYSNLKSMEKNDSSWGELTDEFMFRKNEMPIEGTKFAQTNMYGYAMFGKDLFVNIHLSKMNCSESDKEEMIQILNSLKKEIK
jgi:hypothetical protein